MRHEPTRTPRAATHPLLPRRTWFGTRQSHVPDDSPSRHLAPRKRETVTESCTQAATAREGKSASLIRVATRATTTHTEKRQSPIPKAERPPRPQEWPSTLRKQHPPRNTRRRKPPSPGQSAPGSALTRGSPPRTHSPPYTWALSHAAWNLLRRIERGNTSATATPTLARALRHKHRVAIWCSPEPGEDFPLGWYTAKIIDPQTENHNQHLVQYDADSSTRVHRFMPVAGHTASNGRDRWLPAPPPETPSCPQSCPACGSPTKGGTGAGGTAAYTYTHYHAKVARLSYTCVKCDSKCTAKNPATLARADPTSPRITEPLDCRLTPTRAPKPPPPQRPTGPRQSPRLAALAALAPDASQRGATAAANAARASTQPPLPPPPRPINYRD